MEKKIRLKTNWSLTVSYSLKYTVNSTSNHTLWYLFRSYFKGISANIELQVYGKTCC
jgi:hypothetical protein